MPFKSYDELKDMSAKDPKKAEMYITHAKRMGKPIVSENNPGYNNSEPRRLAIRKRLSNQNTKNEETDPVSKRKQVGY